MAGGVRDEAVSVVNAYQRYVLYLLITNLHLNLPPTSREVALTRLILSSDASFFCLLVKRFSVRF